jgi:formate dehydrogenase major subunit/NADH-quinone oxidoreductase subunit G
MSSITITIDGKTVQANPGDSLLSVALENDFFIPHLCYIPGVEPPAGSCRLCFVEVEGKKKPVTSCSTRVTEGMVVQTRTEAVDRLVRAGFEMLMSVHQLNCKYCPGNKRCALQETAKARKVPLKPKMLPKIEPEYEIDDSRPEMAFNPNHCVLCGQCVHECNNVVNKGVLDYTNRSLKTMVGTFDGRPLAEQECGDCVACTKVCPVHALYLAEDMPLQKQMKDARERLKDGSAKWHSHEDVFNDD